MQPRSPNRTYRINEIFFSLQGEGKRQGKPSVFVRFSGCNLRCDIEPGHRSPGGFLCDTEFVSGSRMSREDVLERCEAVWKAKGRKWVVLTGGEPMLQLDRRLVSMLRDNHWAIQIETNGTRRVPDEWEIDWITVSPKVAEHALKQTFAHEVKYVRGYGQALPETRVRAPHKFISPAFEGMELDRETLQWCRTLADHSDWHLSIQMHKLWKIR
uniref:7-carboxy-7-deazaguanine synthase n=1 Tax=Candidatus Kentrum sp. SD TaxID=2126332 RepID=A0A450YK61_9GAMM|nr:MAG: Organic radical activating enzyme [Candidatus Kentron sp. SD]VFK47834.1 MAG: Organic radical activating enzyme [Candidatus Kentron sp. SD]VFK80685.1 MAG: Organic radical activating enzyme [Candidatus Kentron sp. SD]